MIISLHEQIRGDIEAAIRDGTLAPGDRISTEAELQARYNCSRMTVSKALTALSTAGLVERRKRAGSFVARPRLHAMVLDVPDLPEEVLARGQRYRYRLLRRTTGRSKVSGDDEFDLGPGRVIELSGLHLADEKPLAVEYRAVLLVSAPDIEQASFDTEPPGTWLLRNIAWTEAETRISAIGADARIASLLLVDRGAPLLQIQRRTWRGDDPITVVRQLFRADAYDLFARFKTSDMTLR